MPHASNGVCDDGGPDSEYDVCAWGTDCDDPTRRMRRSILTFEALLGVQAPPRLHACVHDPAPMWEVRCEAGTMAEATDWLANMTLRWRNHEAVHEAGGGAAGLV